MSEDKLDDLDHESKNPVITTLWIGFAISVLGIAGMIITSVFIKTILVNLGIQEMIFRITLGVFVIGVLIISFAFILRRIRKKGLDYFVAGAITAYIGFILLALPVILLAIGSFLSEPFYPYYIVMGVGAILIVFGFLMETYELNKKLIELMKRLKETFLKIIRKVNWKLLFSPWNLLSLAGLTIIILAALSILPFLDALYYYIIGGILILVNIIYHFRKEILEIFKTISKAIATFFKAWWSALKQIPRIIKEAAIWLYSKTIAFFKLLKRAIKYILVRNYFLLFALGIGMFFVLNELNIEARITISSLICLVSIVKPILDWREFFGEEVSRARQFLYKTTQKTRNVLKYRKTIRCPYCDFINPFLKRECWNCKKDIPRCMICNNALEKDEEVAVCPNCDNSFHIGHLETWIRFNSKCPVCHNKIEEIQTEIFSPNEAEG